jgi:hypothetical protein
MKASGAKHLILLCFSAYISNGVAVGCSMFLGARGYQELSSVPELEEKLSEA